MFEPKPLQNWTYNLSLTLPYSLTISSTYAHFANFLAACNRFSYTVLESLWAQGYCGQSVQVRTVIHPSTDRQRCGLTRVIAKTTHETRAVSVYFIILIFEFYYRILTFEFLFSKFNFGILILWFYFSRCNFQILICKFSFSKSNLLIIIRNFKFSNFYFGLFNNVNSYYQFLLIRLFGFLLLFLIDFVFERIIV